MGNHIINEAFWLRAIACLAVVATHSVDTTLLNYQHSASQVEEYGLIFVRFMGYFGTPTFIFISILLLANAYPKGVPTDFLAKRVKYILLPFVFMAFVFAIVENNSINSFINGLIYNIFLGGYTGYFIIIIFQFYILYMWLYKHLMKWSPKVVLSVSFIINISYLAFFNFTEPINIPLGEYIWMRGYWLPFLGWIFYFALGFYCGRYFDQLKLKLRKFPVLICSLPVFSLLLVVVMVRGDMITAVSSKRIDIILYTVSVIFLIVLLASYTRKVPGFILTISKHSFHIYLVHKIFLHYLQRIEGLHPWLYFIFAMVYAVLASILISKWVSKVRVSKFLVGRVLPVPKN
ncbi:acyltransferase family protein [Alkalibacillus aidingensis]|uniref:acyltransferase family protein n=1 Tax=Alkalibacillus aidingensis TaxID=2747607 RepID=UPI001CB717FE|nr:acyltransferase family protein [Alkalibacillus aidingensis]